MKNYKSSNGHMTICAGCIDNAPPQVDRESVIDDPSLPCTKCEMCEQRRPKISMTDLRAQDRVRELEMYVDAVTSNPGVRIQFWRDVPLYGVDEARTYLREYEPDADLTDLDALIERIRDEKEIAITRIRG